MMWPEKLKGEIFSPLSSKVNSFPGSSEESPQMSYNSRKPPLLLFRYTMETSLSVLQQGSSLQRRRSTQSKITFTVPSEMMIKQGL